MNPLVALLAVTFVGSPPEPLPSTVLQRLEPRAWTVQIRGRLVPVMIQGGGGPPLAVRSCEFESPFVVRGPSSCLDVESLQAAVSMVANGPALSAWTGMKDDRAAFGSSSASVVVRDVATRELHLRLQGTVVSYATRIDDVAALDAAWAPEWPAEVAAALDALPMAADIDDWRRMILSRTLGGDDPRTWAPYALAKEIARRSLQGFSWSEEFLTEELRIERARAGWWARNPDGDYEPIWRGGGVVEGGPIELLRATVASLRDVGIPARPVYGIGREDGETVHVAWGEFYLHGPGWIPFDPMVMRANGIQGLRYDQPWRGFGHLPRHARRIPIVYTAFAPGTVLGATSPEQCVTAPTGNVRAWQACLVEARGREARYELSWSMTSAP